MSKGTVLTCKAVNGVRNKCYCQCAQIRPCKIKCSQNIQKIGATDASCLLLHVGFMGTLNLRNLGPPFLPCFAFTCYPASGSSPAFTLLSSLCFMPQWRE